MRRAFVLGIALIIAGCSGGSKNNKDNGPALPPSAAFLVSPSNNQVCTTGTPVSATQAGINFSWQQSNNTDSYDLHIRNLQTGDSTIIDNTKSPAVITLQKGMPYSWYVVSRSTKNASAASSDKWRFFASGPGVGDTSPYPADLDYPAWGQQVTAANGQLTFLWDKDADRSNVKKYVVYLGSEPPYFPLTYSSTTNSQNIYVPTNAVLYWYVVTTDLAGNTVTSQVSQFYVKQ